MKFFFFLIFIAQSLIIYSQDELSITVLDSITKTPIPYASAVFKKKSTKGFYTNKFGVAKGLNFHDTLYISCLGYQSKLVVIEKSAERILLSPKFYSIEEVKIKPTRKKTKTIGYFKNSARIHLVNSYECGTELAVFIPNNAKKTAFIREIQIFVSFHFLEALHHKDFVSVFKINVYRTNNQKVGELINPKSLIFNSNMIKNKTKLDISKFEVIFPPEGAFIAIEWVGVENQQTKNLEKDTRTIDPSIGLTTKPENTIVYKRDILSNSPWKLYTADDETLKRTRLPNYIPRISIKVDY